jgi:hypothetical protein
LRKAEFIKIICKELEEGGGSSRRVLELLDILIAQGGATRGDLVRMKKEMEKNV